MKWIITQLDQKNLERWFRIQAKENKANIASLCFISIVLSTISTILAFVGRLK